MSKGFWAVIAAIVLIFVGVAVFGGNDKTNTTSSSKNSGLSNNVQGKGTTGVTVVEYGDYECPYCAAAAPVVKAGVAEFGDKIKFQFRNFPLVNLHRNAFAAARAAEAAALQGKFWEMHDALYDPSNNKAWTAASNPNPYFEQYAQQIGLNVNKYKTDFSSSQVNDTINADMDEGNRLKITGTPTFFINGKKVEIQPNVDSFRKAVNDAIAQQSASTKSSN